MATVRYLVHDVEAAVGFYVEQLGFELAQRFGPAFADADALVVTDVYSAGEAPIPGVSGQLVVEAVQAQDPRLPVTYAPGREEVRRVVQSILRPGDLCVTLGAGDLTTLPDELLEAPGW